MPWNKKTQLEEQIICACGCKELMNRYDSRNRVRKYAYGHGNRGKKFPQIKHDKQFKKGQPPWNKGDKEFGKKYGFKNGHRGMRGQENPNWRGGFVMRNGYRAIVIDGKKIYIHRHVVEQNIGRKLKKNEHIHHLNHDKLDNRIENLKILSPQEHSRYHANTMWAKYKTGY